MCQFCAVSGLDYHTPEKAGVSRRAVLDGLAAGGLASLLGTFAKPAFAQAADDDVVRIGYLPITDAAALLVAHGKGYFEDEGLKVEKPTLIRGWAPLVEAFAAGKFNLVHLLKPVALSMRYNNNVPVKIMAWAHTNGSGVIVDGGADIKTFADLGGKQIAVPFWYSMHNIVLQYALRQSGLTPVIKSTPPAPNETSLQVMQPPDMPPALAAKKIDGYIVAEPFNAMGELGAGGRMLRFTGDIWKNHPCCVVCMPQPLTEQKPEWTQKIINAIVRAEIHASQHKEETAQLLSRDGAGYLPMPAPVVKRAMTLYETNKAYLDSGAISHPDWRNGRIDFQPWPYPSATRLIVEAMNETLIAGDRAFLSKLDPDFVVKDLVNYEFVRAALEKYPDWKLDPSVNASDPFARQELLAP
ncbi:twin-arginine translocation pathway signal [Methylocella silvestris BL2]|uniref:Twin-arginine translocation pathway signal n=1 Tax=Methylocella silvestris (strain DSM 15510 / CIP 108128 / LMG 27833 / NCIMB 13906 / BL2) TaxID=395965 RepID=B8ETB0_METSB|nr:ABC transporter substrate-binding protein [Methylocella silvestris]ACK51752.1 twin-arginine translocation pathway signal [Methylocella silvestris BL2]